MDDERFRPLPDHTRLDYDECCVKLILEEIFPQRYSNLVLSDKPDLQGKTVGIEVTTADSKESQEALNNWVKANFCEDTEQKKRYIERMSQLGIRYTEGFQVWPSFQPSFEQTQKAIEQKIRKVKKGNYKAFPRYELFILTNTWYEEKVVSDAKAYIFTPNISDYFLTIYVLAQGQDLHVFETKEKQYIHIRINVSEQTERNIRARKMVEKAENE